MRRIIATVGLLLALSAPASAQFAGGASLPVTGSTLDTAAGSPASTGFSVQGFGSAGSSSGGVLSVQGVASGTAIPTSLASLPALATGANTVGKVDVLGNAGGTLDTAAGTPASTGLTVQGFGSAGTASGGVVSVQGVASMTPLLVTPQQAADPCTNAAKTSLAVSTNATAATQIIAASASTKIYLCSVNLTAGGATAFNLLTGTGTNCGTSTAAVMGSTTAANGMSWAANGGITLGSGGASVAVANVAGAELCTFQSNAVYVSGNLTYVQQ